jgi:hypothetical protein
MPYIFKDRRGELELIDRCGFLVRVAGKIRCRVIPGIETFVCDPSEMLDSAVRPRQGHAVRGPDRLKGPLAVKRFDHRLLRFTVDEPRQPGGDQLFQL